MRVLARFPEVAVGENAVVAAGAQVREDVPARRLEQLEKTAAGAVQLADREQ